MADEKVPDGTNSSHRYRCLNDDGEVVASVEAIKYRIKDKRGNELKEWTAISPSAPEGTIEVDGETNRVRSPGDTTRKISIVARHDGGKTKTGYITYYLDDNPGIETADDLAG